MIYCDCDCAGCRDHDGEPPECAANKCAEPGTVSAFAWARLGGLYGDSKALAVEIKVCSAHARELGEERRNETV